MSAGRPASLPLKYRLYRAKSKQDGSVIALVEARDNEQAAARAAYVIGRLGLGAWQEVEIQVAEGYESRVPTFLDGFFGARQTNGPVH